MRKKEKSKGCAQGAKKKKCAKSGRVRGMETLDDTQDNRNMMGTLRLNLVLSGGWKTHMTNASCSQNTQEPLDEGHSCESILIRMCSSETADKKIIRLKCQLNIGVFQCEVFE